MKLHEKLLINIDSKINHTDVYSRGHDVTSEFVGRTTREIWPVPGSHFESRS